MAKFIKFDVKNTLNAANLLLQGTRLLNVDHIGDIAATGATGQNAKTLVVSLNPYDLGNADATNPKTITFGVSADTAAGTDPTLTTGQSNTIYDAVLRAMTANPGGVVSTAQLGKDQAATPVQMYWSTYSVATNDQV